jgi:DNA-directed RNA polymerase I subunit RPA2
MMKSKRKSSGGEKIRAGKLKESIPSVSARFVDEKTRLRLQHLVSSHTDSFSYMLERGIDEAVSDMPNLDMKLSGGKPRVEIIDDGSDSEDEVQDDCVYIRMGCSKVQVACPTRATDEGGRKFTPREARERGLSYTGAMVANFNITIDSNDEPTTSIAVSARLGELPIMVMSEKCNLVGMNAKQLVEVGEEANEMGGYFIQNGIERIVRLLQVPHRNHAFAIQRSSYTNRGNSYSDLGVTMRCVRPDQTSITMTMHYLNNGGATIRFVCRKQEFLLPVVLLAKCLVDVTDKELFDRVLQGDENDTFLQLVWSCC